MDHLGGRHPLGPTQQPVADDLERVPLAVPEEPVHHPCIAEGCREPLVRSFDRESPVERLRLELDVPEREGVRETAADRRASREPNPSGTIERLGHQSGTGVAAHV